MNIDYSQKTIEQLEAIREGVLRWYDFYPNSRVLYVPDQLDNADSKYDYIILSEQFEKKNNLDALFERIKKCMDDSSILLIKMNNRFGIRYFCGDRDPYTNRSFDGIENYKRAYASVDDIFSGRMYSCAEMREMLKKAGIRFSRFYSIINDLNNPRMIYREDYLPNEDLCGRVFPEYNYPQAIFLEEESLYNSLVQNGMFHEMANSYLVECSLREDNPRLSDVVHVTASLERSREDALFTIIHKNNCKMTVEKRPAYKEGTKRISELVDNTGDLEKNGVPVVKLSQIDDSCIMKYIEDPIGQVYLEKLLKEDIDSFLVAMDHFRDEIIGSSEHVNVKKAEKWNLDIPSERMGVVLKRGYVDLVPLNSFFRSGEFVFFDQEYMEEDYPANAIITRMISSFWGWNAELHKLLSPDVMYERYGLLQDKQKWLSMEWRFLQRVWGENSLGEYHRNRRRDTNVVFSNRQRMNYSADDYNRLFVDIFRNADTRKLIVFGTGRYAERFYDLYHYDYPVYAVIDNNNEKWGTKWKDLEVQSPDILREFASGEYKVIVCVKNYISIMKQLDELKVFEYSFFDPSKDYSRKRKPIGDLTQSVELSKKKYHTGYVSGVFDLFHIGHLNLLRRAKEQCDYLIVGVVSDEGVRKHKRVEPFVPFEERIELVKACRYVDEAVEIPIDLNGPKEAWPMFHYDVQFSGSDYVDSPYWLDAQQWLRKHGADLVFFPYTESTNSTNIKELIKKKLM
ncbi:adenylyltransferase/cytidyltransferase family protein [Butyrivibrio sp. LC3010]|uniref:adenylyltransferase/cytidyltransferase family protein n=1 Tax=Butyrivibrio sp. LC3010 TaxID=1280680 RepID=UPI000415D744|nr:adenylyltransferase/cytidyltransferase family protein [Butyrivibrio sp. LC3010]